VSGLRTTSLWGAARIAANGHLRQLVAAGNLNKQIAKVLTISEETVKSHVKNIFEKLGAHSRMHAVIIGLRRGIIELFCR
jgi:DNA-binding NarL/FixJ family response regulator